MYACRNLQTAREVLVEALAVERAELQKRAFWNGVIPRWKKLTRAERRRLAKLNAWLLQNPPAGWMYRCKHCYHGTGDPDRECLGCRYS